MEAAIKDLRTGRHQAAEAACRAALAANPNHELALQVMAVICGDAGDLQRAEAYARRAVKAAPANGKNHNNLGVMLVRQGRHAEAIASYDAALARDPGFADAIRNRANALAAMRKSGSADEPADPLTALEQAVYRRAPEALPLLTQMLFALAVDKAAPADPTAATRIAAAVGTLLTDPGFTPGADDIGNFTALSHTLHGIFALTPFGTTDHLVTALGARDTVRFADLATLDGPRFLKAALLFGLDSRLPIDPEALFAAGPAVALPFYLSQLATRFVATEAGAARRERLLELAPRLPEKTVPRHLNDLIVLGNAWMNCSYASRLDKHAVKRPLNRILRTLMHDLGLADAAPAVPRPRPERPTLLVAAEVMRSAHVQYRYFAPYLRQLRTRFRLVLLTTEPEADVHVRALFDDFVLFTIGENEAYLRPVAEAVLAHRPDIVFWLSVGMRHWGPPLANLRLAPIQIAGLGHSATTHCDSIDYYLTEAGFVTRPELLSEQVLLLPDQGLRFAIPPDQPPALVNIRTEATPARIAVASNLLKLNPGFVATLRRIAERATRPVCYEFFPNAGGIDHAAAAVVLRRALPHATVHPILAPARYLAALAACDLAFSPFPFGGMHSVVDSFRVGVPVLAMDSLDLHGQTDRMLSRLVGMPDWLVAADEDAYLAAALRLIEDDATRVALSRLAAALDIDRTLFETEGVPARTDVVDAVWWVMTHHETIKTLGRKTFGPGDWRVP